MKSETRNPFSVEGKIIVITGGGGFLGQQYVQALSASGARVVIWDGYVKVSDVKHSGYSYYPIDITDEKAVAWATEDMSKTFNGVDVLINNAAMNPAVGSENSKSQFAPYEDYPIELWRKELEVNLTGMMICTKAIARMMIKQHNGSIVNIASEVSNIAHDHRVYGQLDKYKSIAYTTTKTAVLGFTRQWAARLGEHGVRVNSFSPGGVYREGLPEDFVKRFGAANMLGRMARQDEYNGIMQFLCSDASSFMTGANLTADGGKSSW